MTSCSKPNIYLSIYYLDIDAMHHYLYKNLESSRLNASYAFAILQHFLSRNKFGSA